jgi:hypothetical protein
MKNRIDSANLYKSIFLYPPVRANSLEPRFNIILVFQPHDIKNINCATVVINANCPYSLGVNTYTSVRATN